jgi:tryptase
MSAANSAFPILSIGYGKTDESKTDWGVLRRVLSTATGYVPQNPIFTIDQSNDTGICSGDSGGPGFYLKDGNYSIIGVATAIYDLESDTKNRPCRHYGVYTNVLYYADWMLKTITKLNGKSNAEQ